MVAAGQRRTLDVRIAAAFESLLGLAPHQGQVMVIMMSFLRSVSEAGGAGFVYRVSAVEGFQLKPPA